MEKVVFFFSAFSYWTMQITSSGSSDLRVHMGENIILNCSMRGRYEVAWYHLTSEDLILLISAEKDKSGRRLLTHYNQNRTRLKLTADSWVTRVSLTISGVTESDSGRYFCGIKSDAPEMHFDKPIRLKTDEEKKAEDEVTGGVTLTERVLMFGGVALVALVFFLVSVVAGRILYHRGWQKGWREAKRASLRSRKSAK